MTHGTRLGVLQVLSMGATLGLLAGLGEGIGLLVLQAAHWQRWNMALTVSADIIWISALFDLVLFFVVALALILLRCVTDRVSNSRFIFFLFAFFLLLDWLLVSGVTRYFAAFVLATGVALTLTGWFSASEARATPWLRSIGYGTAIATVVAFLGIHGGSWLREQLTERRMVAAKSGAPNVLLIVLDTVRTDHLSNYGYQRLTAPNLNRIAEQGVQFENVYSTSSWTLPSHASMLTGRYPHEHGAVDHILDGRYPTLAEVLRDRGYRTGAFSANSLYFARKQGLSRGFIHFDDVFFSLADMAARTVYGRKFHSIVLRQLGFEDMPARRRAADVNRAALNWMERDRAKPFFAMLNYFDAHTPYLPPQPYRSEFSKTSNPGGVLNPYMGRNDPKMTPDQIQGEIDAYDGTIAYIDAQLGRLVDALDKLGLTQNTILIITSDHGESFGEHGLFNHQTSLYRELIHVPLVIRWPGKIPAGRHIDQPVSNLQIAATVMELVGLSQETFRGPSYARLWMDTQSKPEWPSPLSELAQFKYAPPRYPCHSGEMRSLITRQWHFIVHEKLGPQLYNLAADPAETRDLTETPEGQRIAKEMQNRLQQLQANARERILPYSGGSSR